MRRRHWLPAISLLVATVALQNTRVWAEAPTEGNTASVGPIASGAVISQGSAGFNSSGTSSQAGSHIDQPVVVQSAPTAPVGGTSDVIYKPIPNNAVPVGGAPWVDHFGVIHVAPALPANVCPPGQIGYYVYDATGAITGTVCVGNPANAPAGAPAPSPLLLAEQASASQPWPDLQLSMNPALGLTGLPSWFWLAGSTLMPDATASAGPLTVRVHATLIDVGWSFGDGGGFSSGVNVGRAFPAPSGIQHIYQTDTFDQPQFYLVSALLHYRVDYAIDGGPFNFLGVKARPYVASYQVNQLQPQAVSGT